MKFFSTLFALAMAAGAFAQQWTNLTPLRLNTEVHGVSFRNDMEGVMATYVEGDLFRTTDGGMSWQQIWAPDVSGNLYEVEYVSENVIVTAGSNGGLFRSEDNGNSWNEMNSSTTQFIFSIEFINEQVGIGCGMLGTIIRTTDGGLTWTTIESNSTNRLVDIFFLDETTGYIAGWGGTVLRTTDAGATWSVVDTGTTTNLVSVCFTSAQTGFATGAGNAIFRTTNGGSTWTLQTTNVNFSSLNHIEFSSTNVGWAVGSMGSYYSTTNGGATWTVNAPLGTFDLYCGTRFGTTNALIMGKSRIYKSTNSGSAWTMVKSGTPNTVFYGLWFKDDQHGTAAGASSGVSVQSGIVQTEDGGQTWLVRQQGTSGGYYDLHFPSENVGYAVGGTTLAKTTNGGVNWTITQPITNTFCESIWFTDNNTGFVGRSINNIGISKTTDGGATFTSQPNFLAETMYFINSQVGWAMPEMSSTMYKTVDGGTTWEYWTTPGTLSGRTIFFLDEQIGWVGGQGIVNRTTDGGLTWNVAYFNSEVIGIKFLTPEIGFCVTANNALYTTADGGATWDVILQAVPFVQGNSISAFFTDEYCYVSSSGGMIYRAGLGCEDIVLGTITGDSEWCENVQGQLVVPQVVGATSYEWDLPEGWTGAANNWVIQPTPSAEGGLVSVTVTNQCGETASQLLSVTVTPQVSLPVFSDLPEVICENEGAVIVPDEDLAATVYNYQSTFGMSTFQNGNSLVILPGSGSGTVLVTAENECGESEVTNIPITVSSAPESTLILSADTLCAGLSLVLEGFPEGGVFSGGGVNGNVMNTTGLQAGVYEISYFYSNAFGCFSVAVDSVHVINGTEGPLEIEVPATICSGEEVTFQLFNVSASSEVEWSLPLGWQLIASTNTELQAVVNESGVLMATVSGTCESVVIETAVDIQINPLTPDLTFSEEACEGEEITWLATSAEENVEFGWIVPTDFPQPGNASTWSHQPPPGTYEIAVFAVGSCENSDTLFTEITVSALPEVSILFPGDTLCLGPGYTPIVMPQGGEFSGPGWDGEFVVTTDVPPGLAEYIYSFTSDEGCTATTMVQIVYAVCDGTTEYSFGEWFVYPNPAEDVIRCVFPVSEGLVRITDCAGRLVQEHRVAYAQQMIHLSSISAGTYIITWIREGHVPQSEVMVVQR